MDAEANANAITERDWSVRLWCSQYHRLTALAAQAPSDLLDRFEAVMAEVRDGAPPADAAARHDITLVELDPDEVSRTGRPETGEAGLSAGTLGAIGVDDRPVDGEYRCPRSPRCGRRATAEARTGYEPECAVADRVMDRIAR
ncbi:hypothetical protein [Glycomyces sp. NPDC047010]|uniref:hypothetical protein n=1 Tax=Glycomyces sp. NPDC047010 TaxID=3155023 RepID=UPI0034024822